MTKTIFERAYNRFYTLRVDKNDQGRCDLFAVSNADGREEYCCSFSNMAEAIRYTKILLALF